MQTMKCSFCSFHVPKEIKTKYVQPKGIVVVESGWRELQLHCRDKHPTEPAVKELLFSDAQSLVDLESVVAESERTIVFQHNGHNMFIEQADGIE